MFSFAELGVVRPAAVCFAVFAVLFAGAAAAGELTVDDFAFDGPFGCQGAKIKRLGTNHFEIILGHAPEHPDWCNMLGFVIRRNAKGKALAGRQLLRRRSVPL